MSRRRLIRVHSRSSAAKKIFALTRYNAWHLCATHPRSSSLRPSPLVCLRKAQNARPTRFWAAIFNPFPMRKALSRRPKKRWLIIPRIPS